jgi:UDP-2,3-diacylglucosamine hydrolase
MRAYFLSDIHLRGADDPAAGRLVSFLSEIPRKDDLVIFGGDVFDLFVGDKEIFRTKFANVLASIRSVAERGATVFYLEGNHDFHLDAVFDGLAGVSLKSGDFLLTFRDRKILVSHGDLIDPEDRGYRLLRSVTRHPFFRSLIGLLPGSWIEGVGTRSSHQSRKYTGGLRGANQERLRLLYLAFARRKIREDGAQHVLVGHSHLRDHIPIKEGDRRGEYVNLGFSSEELPYAVLEESAERFEIKSYPSK